MGHNQLKYAELETEDLLITFDICECGEKFVTIIDLLEDVCVTLTEAELEAIYKTAMVR